MTFEQIIAAGYSPAELFALRLWADELERLTRLVRK
jgi:hypothetical protein